MQKFYQVKDGKVIEINGITFQQGARLWLSDQEFELLKDCVDLIYPPES
jgi:hypothetical protein